MEFIPLEPANTNVKFKTLLLLPNVLEFGFFGSCTRLAIAIFKFKKRTVLKPLLYV
jgi:hypothetical protein